MLLVTGGLGFIGSNFIQMCLEEKLQIAENIYILDNLTYAANKKMQYFFSQQKNVNLEIGDIVDSEVVQKTVKECSGVIHFAAETHVDRSILTPQNFISTNILGTWNLLNWSDYYGKRLLVVSTDEVYGSSPDRFFKENDVLNPSSPYSASKAAADLISLSYHQTFKTDVVITRCTNNYGNFQNHEKLIPTIIRKLSSNQKIPIYGNGLNIRNWISVKDHCEGIASAYEKGKSGEIYNFGSNDYFSNIDLCNLFINRMGRNGDNIEYVEDRKGHDFRYAVNFEKSISELGWMPKRRLEENLEDLIEFYRNS